MHKADHSKGIAYLAVLIFVLVITISGLAFVQLGELEDRLAIEESRSIQAQLAAEGGVQRVAWSLRNISSLTLDNVNPFHADWYMDPAQPLNDTSLLDVVNPKTGETFHPGSPDAYYQIADVKGAMTRVGVRVLGAVDTDGDGDQGIGDLDGDGYFDLSDADPQDTNRFLEAFLGLPGTLGQDVAIAASDILDRNGDSAVLRHNSTVPDLAIQTSKLQNLNDFWFHNRVYGSYYREVFSNRIVLQNRNDPNFQGQVELPRGLFLPDGTPDMNYFAGLPMRIYDGNQTFSPDTVDPTAGSPAGEIIWVNGNIFLNMESSSPWDGIDLESDWERQDVVLVGTGNIRCVNLSCGWGARVALIAKNIDLEYWKLGDQINGLAIASGDIRLESTSASNEREVLVENDFPTYQASYFYGTLLAGGNIRLNHGGWAVIFDQNVINGIMGLQPPPRVLDRFEGEGLGSCWTSSGAIAEMQQGAYLQDEIDHRVGDYLDTGVDGTAEVLRITMRPRVTDSGVSDEVQFLLDGSPGGDCTPKHQDWRDYGALRLSMALDNYRVDADGDGNPTEREAKFWLVLRDGNIPPNELYYKLNDDSSPCVGAEYEYSEDEWGKEPYKLTGGDVTDPDISVDNYQSGDLPRWKRVDLPVSCFKGDLGTFDFQNVREILFQMNGLELRWPIEGGGPGDHRMVTGAPGALEYDGDGEGGDPSVPMRVDPADPNGRLQYWDTTTTDYVTINWDENGGGTENEELYESDFVTSLRLDRLVLPGIDRRNYGLTPLSLEVSGRRELSAEDVGP